MIVASALGAPTDRFVGLWFVQQAVDCTMEEGVEQVTKIFVNALGLDRST